MTVDRNALKAAGLTDAQIDFLGLSAEAVPAEPVAVPQARDASDFRTPVSPEPEPVEKSTPSEPDVLPPVQVIKPSRSVLHAALDAFLDAAGF